MILRIVAQDFVAGVEIENGVVRDAAPVIHYMLGWPDAKVLDFCYLKGWSASEFDCASKTGPAHRSGAKKHMGNAGIGREQPLAFLTVANGLSVAQCHDLGASSRLSCCNTFIEDRASDGASNKGMDLKTKLVQWKNQGYYLIVVGRGELTRESLKKLFRTVREATRTILECKILIDLQDATTVMTSADIDTLMAELAGAFTGQAIVFVCPAESYPYFALRALSTGLTDLGHRAVVFADPKKAIDWLAAME